MIAIEGRVSADPGIGDEPPALTVAPHFPQNLLPARFRYPQTRQAIPVGSLARSWAASMAPYSASCSAAKCCAASSAAEIPSDPGFGPPAFRLLKNSSNSGLPAVASTGRPDAGDFLSFLSTDRVTCEDSSPVACVEAIGWRTRFFLPFPWERRCRSPGDTSTSLPFAKCDGLWRYRRSPKSRGCAHAHRCR